MIRIGIARESKTPQDNRVAFTPKQCKWIKDHYSNVEILVQPSPIRCFSDQEYCKENITLQEDLSSCDVIFGVKEVKPEYLIPNKTYLFFSHTKKKQAYNQGLMHTLISKNIRMIDYECLVHDDGQRIVGFGFFAGVVGAHNGIMTYGKKTGLFDLTAVHQCKSFQDLIHTYFGLKLPNIKIAVTGSGRVASGILEIMNLLDIKEVEPEDYLAKTYEYPVFVHLKGRDLYSHKDTNDYTRDNFHEHPEQYACKFLPYTAVSDIVMNGIYWDTRIPRLFELGDMKSESFQVKVISDITCDINGSIPCNIESSTIAEPVYGFNRYSLQKELPYLNDDNIVDVMAVDNLPNELPRDASHYFGEFMEKYVLNDLIHNPNSALLQRATICEKGKLGKHFEYLSDYAYV